MLSLIRHLVCFLPGVIWMTPYCQVFSLRPSKDALVRINTGCPNWQTSNGGNYDFTQIMSWTWFANNCADGNIRTFMEFDINGFMVLHPKCFPEQALLELKFIPGSNQTQDGQNDFTIEMVTAPWGEMTITWDNQPGVTSVNSIALPASVSQTQDYQVDLTPMVKDWSCGQIPNNGMRMKLNTEALYRRVTMATKEHADTSLHPRLHIYAACVDLGPDTAICSAVPYYINGAVYNSLNSGQYSYQWTSIPAGFTASTSGIWVQPSEPTYYILEVTRPDGCTVSDTVLVDMSAPDPVDMGNDTLICDLETYQLTAPAGYASYQWDDASSGMVRPVYTSGTYWLEVIDSSSCIARDSITITIASYPEGQLKSGAVCGYNTVLDAENQGADYVWNTGATTQTLYITEPGTYWVTMTNACGKLTDTVHITFRGGNFSYIPNVFTPNGDGINEQFLPVLGSADNYRLSIFNRWGALIYETRNPKMGWNAHTVTGGKVAEGVYLYRLEYLDCENENRRLTGHVTVLR